MNTLSKTLITLISGLIIAVTGILLYVYWPAITGTINDSQYLTPEQGQEMYDKGYADGNKANEEQIAQIAYYKELTDEYYIQVGLLNNEISTLNGQIVTKNAVITELTNLKNANLQTIEELNTTISSNETVIADLNTQISALQGNRSSLETQISSLNADISNKQVIITGLNSQITELQTDITTKRNQIVNLNTQISDLQAQIIELQNSASSNSSQIESLRSQITTLTNEKADLESSITNKDSQISSLNTQIASLNNSILDLQAQITSKENTISTLSTQIVNLQTLNTQLSQTNQSNASTISTLNAQVVSLNNQINTLSLQIQNNSSNVASLNNRIAELEESIAYYESFISGLQSETQVVATFMYDGSVYNIQVLSKNAYASVTTPASTTYMIFNGWKVDGQSVNLASYSVSENTTFVADITYKYDVTFVVDNETYNSQIVVANNSPTLPTAPTKTNYQFDGWTVNGSITTPNTYAITQDTTFVAKFTRLYTATFTYENTTKSTQIVRNGEYASNVAVANTTYKIFNGWKVGGVIVNVGEFAITQDTTFVADITYKYDVVYKVDNTNYNTQIVVNGGYASLPENPTKSGYEFDGWTLNGTTVINPTAITINANTTFVAKFTKLHTVTFTYEGTTKSTQTIRNNSYATNVSVADTTYKIFNGWKLNGTIVNVANTQITADTTFVADITYRYDVVFKVDNSNYNTQVVTANGGATAPANPSKTGYTFNGWTLNGTDIVNVANTSITGNTTFIAKFTINSYTVTFKYENTTLSTQTVNYGSSATDVNATSTTYKVFNGWKLNGTIVDVTTQQITGNTIFTADITYKYDVVFKVDNSDYNTQIVTKNNYANVPTAPSKFGYTFDGWCLNGNVVVNVSEIAITGNTTFTAKFTLNAYTVNFVSENVIIDTQSVNANNYATVPTAPTKNGYQFDGWTLDGQTVVDPLNNKIIANTTYIAKFTWRNITFANASWSLIQDVSTDIKTNNLTSSQVASKYGWHIGDEKTFTLSTNEEVTIQILGYNHDDLSNGNGKAGISFGMKNLLATKYGMNISNTNEGGWDTSSMRTNAMATIFSQLPSELRSVIVSVDKKTSAGNKSTTITISSDKLWLFSEVEIDGTTNSVYKDEGSQYEFWQTQTLVDFTADRIPELVKYLSNGTGAANNWWLRTSHKNSSKTFWYVSPYGNFTNYNASNSYGVCFGFCI
ncbi:MAG: InlB B-repeat-containing protein [Clostridia bacterium]|nr:InlB B-repeat-containing protein [Clostridia bacterium]MBR1653622.1 InlB B-repeat-containing protein [Clostridia bacterium]